MIGQQYAYVRLSFRTVLAGQVARGPCFVLGPTLPTLPLPYPTSHPSPTVGTYTYD